MTLPLIYTLGKVSWLTKRQIIHVIKNQNTNIEKVRWVIDLVRKEGGMDYAITKMKQSTEEALELLHTFPESPARVAIAQLIDYTIQREK
jgi:octaprenyl-diphosphate synthase